MLATHSETKAISVALKDAPEIKPSNKPIVSIRDIPYPTLINAFLQEDFNARYPLVERLAQGNIKDIESDKAHARQYLTSLKEKEQKQQLQTRELSLAALLLFTLREYDAALAHIKRALNDKPEEKVLKIPKDQDPDISITLGLMIFHGRRINKNLALANQLFQQATNAEHPDGAYNLGLSFLNGDGVVQNIESAFYFSAHAAENDHPEAWHMLGLIYSGKYGVYKPNDRMYFSAMQRSAKLGSARAMYNLGNCYYLGSGIDVTELFYYHGRAAKWYHHAFYHGINSARYNLEMLYTRYSDQDNSLLAKFFNTHCKHPVVFHHYMAVFYTPEKRAKIIADLDAYYHKTITNDDITLYEATVLLQTPKLTAKFILFAEANPDLFAKLSYHEPREIIRKLLKDKPELVDKWDRYLLKYAILNKKLPGVLIDKIFSFLKAPVITKPLADMHLSLRKDIKPQIIKYEDKLEEKLPPPSPLKAIPIPSNIIIAEHERPQLSSLSLLSTVIAGGTAGLISGGFYAHGVGTATVFGVSTITFLAACTVAGAALFLLLLAINHYRPKSTYPGFFSCCFTPGESIQKQSPLTLSPAH